ncbi:DinB family protein [Flavisolibacter sp. BT320]|nr:DinB family protein [Flavisolibacter longurius]
MTRNLFLASRLREVLLNGQWIANTNFKEQVQSVNWLQATHKVESLNTIAALTFHINYYLAGLLFAFQTGRLEIRDKYSFDLPPIKDAGDWEALVAEFLQNAENFASAVEQIDDDLFERPFIDEKYGTYLRNIEGVIEHSNYHLGQVVLLRKLVTQNLS